MFIAVRFTRVCWYFPVGINFLSISLATQWSMHTAAANTSVTVKDFDLLTIAKKGKRNEKEKGTRQVAHTGVASGKPRKNEIANVKYAGMMREQIHKSTRKKT